jgi:ribosomal protein S18 acetylase RimI-like enzyme
MRPGGARVEEQDEADVLRYADHVLIEPMLVSDLERVGELVGSGFDPAVEMARPWGRLFVARAAPGGAALGVALIWRAADETHLLDLVVDAGVRRQGYGRALLERVIADARAAGGRVVLLEVRASNSVALTLYRAAGFFESGVRSAYYSDNGEDAIEMRLDLSAHEKEPPPTS